MGHIHSSELCVVTLRCSSSLVCISPENAKEITTNVPVVPGIIHLSPDRS